MVLATGTQIPDFKLQDEHGKWLTRAGLKGMRYILFYFSEADTDVCTAQACNFGDNYDYWKKQGYEVYSISPDTPEALKKFKAKYKFKYHLLSDPDYSFMKKCKAWGDKLWFGKTVTGLHRNIYAIDESGKIIAAVERALSKKSTQQLQNALG